MANAARERGSYQDWGSRPNLMSDVSVFPHHHPPNILHTSLLFFPKLLTPIRCLKKPWFQPQHHKKNMQICNIGISPRVSRLHKLIKYIKWNVSVRLKLHSAVLDLRMHAIAIQMWISWPVFPSSSLNCLFLHYCASFLFLSFSHCFLIITSSPLFTGSLFLVLLPRPPPALCLVERIHFRFLMLRANVCDTVHHFPLHSSCFLPLLPH